MNQKCALKGFCKIQIMRLYVRNRYSNSVTFYFNCFIFGFDINGGFIFLINDTILIIFLITLIKF